VNALPEIARLLSLPSSLPLTGEAALPPSAFFRVARDRQFVAAYGGPTPLLSSDKRFVTNASRSETVRAKPRAI